MEILHNGYLKIKPIEYSSFIASQKTSYEEVGEVIATANTVNVPIGSLVKFDGFMAKKYPVVGKEDEYEWYIKYDEIVSHVISEV